MKDYKYSVEVSLSETIDRGVETTELMKAIGDAIQSVLGEPKSGVINIHSPLQWISFEDLVNPDDSFKPCPNCGERKIGSDVGGSTFTPIISDPYCKNCGSYFKPEKKGSREGFKIVVP